MRMPSRREYVMNDYWKDERREMNRYGRFGLGWIIAIVVVIAVISLAGWGFKVLFSEPKGRGDALIEKNSAKNWVKTQKEFNDRYQDILATDLKIDAAKDAWKADKDNAVLQTNYNGLVNYCLSAVGEYNSLARSYLAADFRDADLPAEIDLNDPTNSTTDCKENKR